MNRKGRAVIHHRDRLGEGIERHVDLGFVGEPDEINPEVLETIMNSDLIPVVALKVGRTESSKAMVTAHSGALAGEHGAESHDRSACDRFLAPSRH